MGTSSLPKTWTFQVRTFPAGAAGQYDIVTEEDATLYGVFLVPPDNQEIAAVFITQSRNEVEEIEHAIAKAQRTAAAKQNHRMIEAAEWAGIALEELTDDVYGRYLQSIAKPADMGGNVTEFTRGLEDALGDGDS